MSRHSDNCSSNDDTGSVLNLTEDMKSNGTLKTLASSGLHGVAAAAAIKSSQKQHGRLKFKYFEKCPKTRNRTQKRLLRKLNDTLAEYSTRVGEQAAVIIAMPKSLKYNKVFGTEPLVSVIKKIQPHINEMLDRAVTEEACNISSEETGKEDLFYLPPLIIDGIPVQLDKMTQAQLRAFIPLMLKFSLGRGKPAWGKEAKRPPWWPNHVPWANIRMDSRSEEIKEKISWTNALRDIVRCCYLYHDRRDLLENFEETDIENTVIEELSVKTENNNFILVQNPDDTYSLVHLQVPELQYQSDDSGRAFVPENDAETTNEETDIDMKDVFIPKTGHPEPLKQGASTSQSEMFVLQTININNSNCQYIIGD